MKRQPFLAVALVLALCTLAVFVGLSYAQGPGQQGGDGLASPLGSAFTYQGQLRIEGEPVSGDCALAFRLYDEGADGNQIGSAITATVPISDGLFTVALDFGSGVFNGEGRWLGIQVQCPGDAGFADLGSQALTAAPYALHALQAPWAGIADMPPGFADGVDDDTTYSAGFGLDLDGQTFAVVTDTVQARVSEACGTDYAVAAVHQDGSVTCVPVASASHSHYALDAADGNPTEALYVDNDGEVGIGTTTPAGPLHISSASAPNALVVLENGDVGIGTDAPYEAHVHIINPDTTSGSWSSLKIGGLNIPSSTPYNANLQLRTSAGGVAQLYFNDRFQATGVQFRKEADVGMGAWFRVNNRHDGPPDQTVYQFYNSGSSSSANDRMAVLVPLGIGTTDPQSALQVEGYTQLDTLTAAPPAADCDESSERGRMKVDIVNDLLYICTNSGWITK